jgi:hypothetical protein
MLVGFVSLLYTLPSSAIAPGAGQAQMRNNMQQMEHNKQQIQYHNQQKEMMQQKQNKQHHKEHYHAN